MSDSTDTKRYRVVINDEQQYSIWAEGQPLPLGWTAEGKSGSRDECLAHIKVVWTDMRPLSLRQAMAGESASTSTTAKAA